MPRGSATPQENDSSPDWRAQNEGHIVLYESLTARVGHRDALLWQSPALAMTAQAFLLTIALSHETRPLARFLAAGLGLVVTYMSIQLMLKHRLYMTNDQVTMVSLEREMGLPTSAIDYVTQLRHLRQDSSKPSLYRNLYEKKGFTNLVSVNVWIFGLKCFGAISIFLMGLAVVQTFVACEGLTGAGLAQCVVAL